MRRSAVQNQSRESGRIAHRLRWFHSLLVCSDPFSSSSNPVSIFPFPLRAVFLSTKSLLLLPPPPSPPPPFSAPPKDSSASPKRFLHVHFLLFSVPPVFLFHVQSSKVSVQFATIKRSDSNEVSRTVNFELFRFMSDYFFSSCSSFRFCAFTPRLPCSLIGFSGSPLVSPVQFFIPSSLLFFPLDYRLPRVLFAWRSRIPRLISSNAFLFVCLIPLFLLSSMLPLSYAFLCCAAGSGRPFACGQTSNSMYTAGCYCCAGCKGGSPFY